MPDEGDNFLEYPEETMWLADRGGKGHTDLIRLSSVEPRDTFTSLINGNVVDLYHNIWGKRTQVREATNITPKTEYLLQSSERAQQMDQRIR